MSAPANQPTVDRHGVLDRLMFGRAGGPITTSRRHQLQRADLVDPTPSEDPRRCTAELDAALARSGRSSAGLQVALWRTHTPAVVAMLALGLAHALTSSGSAYLLRDLLSWLRAPGDSGTGLVLALSLLVLGAVAWVTIAHNFFLGERVALRIRGGLIAIIQRKALVLAPHAQGRWAAGRIVNLVSIDVERVATSLPAATNLVMSLTITLVSLVLLYLILEASAMVGVATLVILVASTTRLTRRLGAVVTGLDRHTDRRLELVQDVLAGLRTLKLEGGEANVIERFAGRRAEELERLRVYVRRKAALELLFLSMPVFVSTVTFAVHVLLGHALVVADVFAVVAIFGLLRPAVLHTPQLLVALLDARVSRERLAEFFAAPEIEAPAASARAPGTVVIEHGSFGWAPQEASLVIDQLRIEAGQLVAVMGSVGSGKTTLLTSLLGETLLLEGRLERAGRVGWARQGAFVAAGTIRENILYHRPFDAERYQQALDLSELVDDIEQLAAGENTRLSAGGSNLSGGQRQRIELARAIYTDAEILVLDHPTGALDNTVARRVVERGLLGRLADRTRIIATDRLDIALAADQVVVLDAGRVVEQGPPEQLRQQPGRFAEMLELGGVESMTQPAAASDRTATTAVEAPLDAADLVEDQRETGAVDARLYRQYLALLAPGALAAVLVLLFVLREVSLIASDLWLAFWSTAETLPRGLFLAGLLGLGLPVALLTFVRTLVVSLRGVEASRALHDTLVRAVVHAPLKVLERIDGGWLLTRFGLDMRSIDRELSFSFVEVGNNVISLVAVGIIVIIATPLATIVVIPTALAYLHIQRRFRPAIRDVKRLDAVDRGPVVGLIAETVDGLSTARVYGVQPQLEDAGFAAVARSVRATYTHELLYGWLGVRLELLGVALTGTQALVAVLTVSSISPAFVALSLTYTLTATYVLGRTVRSFLMLEDMMNAVERIDQITQLPREPQAGTRELPPGWPGAGRICFEDVVLRYQPDQNPVLHGVSFTVGAGEHLGIVGRTGGGKSSLFAALLRVVELEAGRISIDGVDVSEIALGELRGRIEVIPQDPYLFAGTIRTNLCSAGTVDDERLWDALGRVGARALVESSPNGLDTSVERGGVNFSAGQRQLLRLARALVRNTQILLIDEVTSNLDPRTAQLLSEAMADAGRDRTVLTITHRIETVLGADRVLVMDGGKVLELDTPAALLATGQSALGRLAGPWSPSNGDER